MHIARFCLTAAFLTVLFLGVAAPWAAWMDFSGPSGYVLTATGAASTPTFQPTQVPAIFLSAKITANGTSQATPHGLGVSPRVVVPVVVKLPALAGILTLAQTIFSAYS